MKKELTLKDIAGYATEKTVWQMMLNLAECCGQGKFNQISSESIIVTEKGFLIKDGGTSKASKAFFAPEMFYGRGMEFPELSEVWSIGALAFYAITGMAVFEGMGGETQTMDTEIPRISSFHASRNLCELVHKCLSFNPNDRPSIDEIQLIAQKALSTPSVPRKRLASQTGKSYKSSLVRFWPEEMIPLILVVMFQLFSGQLFAQKFDKSAITNEMASLVMRCIDLRSPKNLAKVSKEMDRDMSWTMMDEIAIDKEGECTTKDIVDMFGINDVGFSILKRHGGITNAGGRFRDGRDPRYKYSFIEITVKQNATVSYQINGREGEQVFAVVPFEKEAQFVASIPKGDSFTDNGVCYIRLKQGIKKEDTFKLKLINKSGKNMAFVLINYNARNHE